MDLQRCGFGRHRPPQVSHEQRPVQGVACRVRQHAAGHPGPLRTASASGTTSPVVPLDAQGNQMAFLGLADLDNYVPTSNCEGIYRGDGDNYLDIW